MTFGPVAAIADRPGARQFIKFCIVGASSFVIDIGLLNVFHFGLGIPLIYAKTLSFLLAVCNGFYWNRKWTFRAFEGDPKAQYTKFVLTNTVGLFLNLTIMTSAILLATRLGYIHTDRSVADIIMLLFSGQGKNVFNPVTINLATIVATVFTTAWNFLAAKFFTFKR